MVQRSKRVNNRPERFRALLLITNLGSGLLARASASTASCCTRRSRMIDPRQVEAIRHRPSLSLPILDHVSVLHPLQPRDALLPLHLPSVRGIEIVPAPEELFVQVA